MSDGHPDFKDFISEDIIFGQMTGFDQISFLGPAMRSCPAQKVEQCAHSPTVISLLFLQFHAF